MKRSDSLSKVDCSACIMRARSDWRVLEGDEVELLSAGQYGRSYKSGERVFAAGESSRGIYCICSGTVAIRRFDIEGNSVLVQLAYAGDTLGYDAFLGNQEHHATAETVGPSTICFVEKPTVRALLEKNPALGLQFLRRATADLNDARDKLVQNATLSNRAKFAHLLLVLMDRYARPHQDGERTLDLPLSRRDLASMIGTRHETLSRIIARLEEDGVARFSGRTVRIQQVDALVNEIRPQLVG